MSARGMTELQVLKVVELMDVVMMNQTSPKTLKKVADEVLQLCNAFPVNGSAK